MGAQAAAASSTPLDDCSPTSSVCAVLLGSWVAMFLRVMWKAATVACAFAAPEVQLAAHF